MTVLSAGLQVDSATVVLGVITGFIYGVSGIGLVLVYRSSKIINFAHGQVGTIAAAFLGLATTSWGVPYWVAFALALALGAAVGAASESVLARRLRDAPLIISVVATLGLSQVLFLLASLINSGIGAGATFPQPPGLPTFRVGALLVTPAYAGMLFVTPVLVLGLAAFLRRGRLGVAMRAAAANPDAARMSGIVSDRMAGLSWALAGALATYTAILVLPTRGFSGADFLGPGLLLRSLACAVLARMQSLPLVLAAGIGLGVLEALVLTNYQDGGLVDTLILGIIAISLLTQRRAAGRAEDKGVWASVLPWAPLPDAFRGVRGIRNTGRVAAALGLILASLLPLVVSNAMASTLSVIAAFTIVGLSVGILTGLAGQLSLGQFAVAGVGATVCARITAGGGNFAIGLLLAGFAAAAVSLLLGLPALRIRGLMLAVTSMAFAVAASTWFFGQNWMLGAGVQTRPPELFGMRLESGPKYYYFALALLVLAFVMARNVWVGGLGRKLRAVRDNEDAARAFTIAPSRIKLQAFVLAGFLAGVGGAVYGSALAQVSRSAFPLDASINVAATAVLGGLGLLAGPLLGAIYILGLPRFVDLDAVGLSATALGWMLLVLAYPGGIAQSLRNGRDMLADALARRAGLDPAAERSAVEEGPARPALVVARNRRDGGREAALADTPLLSGRGLSVRFGGVAAVNDVSFQVERGETLGLIGPNGAGKTTLFEVLSGFVRPDSGQVLFDGRDVTRKTPEHRARLGLIRSFQDAALFPTMTVLEVVALSQERLTPSGLVRPLLGLDRSERVRQAEAEDLVGALGLHAYRHTQIRALSTGTRRIAEIACLVALEPSLLLLDEPTSGIAQRETEALGDLLRHIKSELDLTIIIIEHDIPLVMSLSDRVIAMESGAILAEGLPEAVRQDPRVVEAYMGGDLRAIERSQAGAPGPAHTERVCGVMTRAGHACSRLPVHGDMCTFHAGRVTTAT